MRVWGEGTGDIQGSMLCVSDGLGMCLLRRRRDYTVSLVSVSRLSSPGELTMLETSAPVPDLRKSVPAWPPVASIKVKVPCL